MILVPTGTNGILFQSCTRFIYAHADKLELIQEVRNTFIGMSLCLNNISYSVMGKSGSYIDNPVSR